MKTEEKIHKNYELNATIYKINIHQPLNIDII